MKTLANKFICLFLLSLFATASMAKETPIYYDFNSIPVHQLTDKITMRFINSSKFTVIQWDIKAGGKLLPVHTHPNEQVTKIVEGDVDVKSGEDIYHLHAGDIMVFPANVSHGFVALTNSVIYEQQTPAREDFLQPGFVEKLSALLRQNQDR